MKRIKWGIVLLFCILYTTIAFGAEMTAKEFFDLDNSEKITRLQIQEKATGNIVNVVKQEEIQKAYDLLQNTKFSKIMTYDAYARNNNITTGDYIVTGYQNDTVAIKFDVTQQKIYNEKWVLLPENTPIDFYYFTRYMVLTKENYKKSFTEEDFQRNMILWKENPITFQKNQPYWNETHGVMAEWKTLNTVFNANAAYDVNTQTITIKDKKTMLFGENKNGMIYVAVQPFAELLCYDTVWDSTLKILSIKEKKNDNALWESVYGKPEIYAAIDTLFENNISFQTFLNIDMQKLFSKIVIQNEKTNHITTITNEDDLKQAENSLKNTTVYEITTLNTQKQQGLLRYKVTLYQDDEAVKEMFFTSENCVKDNTYYVQCSTGFFDWFYHISEIDYAKAILSK